MLHLVFADSVFPYCTGFIKSPVCAGFTESSVGHSLMAAGRNASYTPERISGSVFY